MNEWPHVVSLVGAGGKTTLMYALAEHFVKHGAKTIVTTTTHIYRPEHNLWARTPEEVRNLWSQGFYAVVGLEAENGKLQSLPVQELDACIQMADIVLIEADGAKRMPCKVPAAREPVIPKSCDTVIGVMGMDAVGKPLEQVCFRLEEAVKLLDAAPVDLLTVEMAAKILASEEGTRKQVGNRDYYVVLNKCDSKERIRAAEQIRALLEEKGIHKCILTSFLKTETEE